MLALISVTHTGSLQAQLEKFLRDRGIEDQDKFVCFVYRSVPTYRLSVTFRRMSISSRYRVRPLGKKRTRSIPVAEFVYWLSVRNPIDDPVRACS